MVELFFQGPDEALDKLLLKVSVVTFGFSRTGIAVDIGVTGSLLGSDGCARVVTLKDAHELLRAGF